MAQSSRRTKIAKHNAVSTPKKDLSQKIANTLTAYFTSQFIVVVIVSVASALILSLLGVKLAILLGLITGALSVVPVFGLIIAALLASAVATLDNARFLSSVPEIIEGLAVLGIFILFNFLTDMLLSPYLTGKITHVHPLIILAVVIAGSLVFGFIGTILAVPTLLVVLTILKHQEEK
jgi:predicted PurR-regulated permease PerM